MQLLHDRTVVKIEAKDFASEPLLFEEMKLWLYNHAEEFFVNSSTDSEQISFILNHSIYDEFYKLYFSQICIFHAGWAPD